MKREVLLSSEVLEQLTPKTPSVKPKRTKKMRIALSKNTDSEFSSVALSREEYMNDIKENGTTAIYDPDKSAKQIYRLRLAGLSNSVIADVMMISLRTLLDWRNRHPKVAKAWEEGGAHADGRVANAMFLRATGYEHKSEKVFYNAKADRVVKVGVVERYAPDTAAAEFWLTNRRGGEWKKKSSSEITGADGKALAPPTIIINPVLSPRAQAPMIEATVTDVDGGAP